MVEIDHGPYLVKPVDEAFDDGERPVNIDVSNIVWLNDELTDWINTGSDAELSFLLTNGDKRSIFVKIPGGYSGEIESLGTMFHSVVIKGELTYQMPDKKSHKVLDTGSYFGSKGKTNHHITNDSDSEVIIYIRTDGTLSVS